MVALLVCVAVYYYAEIEGWPLLDAPFMVAITTSTVGCGEVHPLTPSARALNGDLFIVARCDSMEAEGKLLRAGAASLVATANRSPRRCRTGTRPRSMICLGAESATRRRNEPHRERRVRAAHTVVRRRAGSQHTR